MPFTLSHAAAALPLDRLLRGRAVFSLLVIGAFLPDVPYFLPQPLAGVNAHRQPGLLLFGLPCGWILYAAWRHLLLVPFAALLPPAWAAALLASARAERVRAGTGSASLLLGALSHIVWDTFTHRRGLAVHVWPQLAQPVWRLGDHAVPPYVLFQHGSTLFGFVCLVLFVRRRVRAAPPGECIVPGAQPSAREKIAAIALLALAALVLVGARFAATDAPVLCAYNAVCGTVSAAAAVAMVYAAVWHARFSRAPSA